ncbi:hypothetical protein B0T19DRAFT_420139 [Cercophora scortea]|uniref:Uncharacterized protein n=1 Tax=Cercophora scortea TaxID=314031 RepID=A0AAE0MIW7_9PEZI|nr:hypothetical protein B0T19DRAFT_420139 [Cercophora scortea]
MSHPSVTNQCLVGFFFFFSFSFTFTLQCNHLSPKVSGSLGHELTAYRIPRSSARVSNIYTEIRTHVSILACSRSEGSERCPHSSQQKGLLTDDH